MSEADHVERFAVAATSESETKTVVEAREFEFVVDEPPALDGTNDGPNPVEYLLGSWAGCLNVVAHTVAAERDIDIGGVTIDIDGDLDPRRFLGLVDDGRAGYQQIRVTLSIDADVDEETLHDLTAEIEERCPVGDNLQNQTPTEVTVTTA